MELETFFELSLEGKACIECKGRVDSKGKSVQKIFLTEKMALDHVLKLCQDHFVRGYFIVKKEENEGDEENEENKEKKEDEKQENGLHDKNLRYNNTEKTNEKIASNEKSLESNLSIDKYITFKEECHVYKTSDFVYDVTLNNGNNYCKIQILETHQKPNQYYSYARNYLIGYPGNNKICGPFYDASICIYQFHKNIEQAFDNFKEIDDFTTECPKFFEAKQSNNETINTGADVSRCVQNNKSQTIANIPNMYDHSIEFTDDENDANKSQFNCLMRAQKNNNFYYDQKKRNEFLHQKFKERERKRFMRNFNNM